MTTSSTLRIVNLHNETRIINRLVRFRQRSGAPEDQGLRYEKSNMSCYEKKKYFTLSEKKIT